MSNLSRGTVRFLESVFLVFMSVDEIFLTDIYDFKIGFQRCDCEHPFRYR